MIEKFLTKKGVFCGPRSPGGPLPDTRLEVDPNLPLHPAYSVATYGIVVNEKAVVRVFCDEISDPVGHSRTRPGDPREVDTEGGVVGGDGVFPVVFIAH